MSDKIKILVVSPPVARSTKEFLEGTYETLELLRLPSEGSSEASTSRGLGGLGRRYLQFRSARKSLQPDAIYLELGEADAKNLLLLAAVRPLFPKLILHLQATGLTESFNRLSGWQKMLFRRAYWQPDLAITRSKSQLPDAEFLQAKESVVASKGIADVWVEGLHSKRNRIPYIFFHGRVSEQNGVEDLIEACKVLKSKAYEFRLQIIGPAESDQFLSTLKKAASDLGTWVSFPGPVTDADKWDRFAENDIFCYPTRDPAGFDGSGVLEATMSGLPVVTTDFHAYPEIVLDGKTGFVVAPKDVPALTDRLKRLIKDSILQGIMGNAARNRYKEHYTVEMARYRIEEAVEKLVQPTENAEKLKS